MINPSDIDAVALGVIAAFTADGMRNVSAKTKTVVQALHSKVAAVMGDDKPVKVLEKYGDSEAAKTEFQNNFVTKTQPDTPELDEIAALLNELDELTNGNVTNNSANVYGDHGKAAAENFTDNSTNNY